MTLTDGTALLVGAVALRPPPISFPPPDTTITFRYTPQTGDWTPSGQAETSRAAFTLAALGSGQVLMAGGSSLDGASTALASAELYDPVTGAWTMTGPLRHARSGHTATLLTDGRVLVAGGSASDSSGVQPAELFDPSSGSWSSTGSLGHARKDHMAVALLDGRVLVAGGISVGTANPLSSAEIFDPVSGTWSFMGPMQAGRAGIGGIVLQNGQVLALGGASSSSELFDPVTGLWTPGPDTDSLTTPFARRNVRGVALLADGTALALVDVLRTTPGPCSATSLAFLYDPTHRLWTRPDGNAYTSRTAPFTALAVLADGRPLAAGGTRSLTFGCAEAPRLQPSPAAFFLSDGSTAPLLAVAPQPLVFGAVGLGPTTRTVTISNVGGSPLVWTAAATSPFTSPLPASPQALDPGQSMTVVVELTPASSGRVTGRLDVNGNGGLVSVELKAEVGILLAGQVRLGGLPAPGVTVGLTGGATGSAVTDLSGRYAFAVAPDNGYTLTARVPGHAVTPQSRGLVAGHTDLTGQDFDLTLQDPVAAFVGALYATVLGRAAGPAELDALTAHLRGDCGFPRIATAVLAFFDSGEFRARVLTLPQTVAVLYGALLGRAPDPPGGQAVEGHLRALRVFIAVQGIAHSAEFPHQLPVFESAPSVSQLVERLYQELLGRPATPTESAAWIAYLRATRDVDGAVTTFVASGEMDAVARTDLGVVEALYQALLQRSAEPFGWPALLHQDVLDTIAGSFLPSPELHSRVAELCR